MSNPNDEFNRAYLEASNDLYAQMEAGNVEDVNAALNQLQADISDIYPPENNN